MTVFGKTLCSAILLVFAATSMQGCILVPFVDAFKQAGVAEGDRQRLLAPDMKRFGDNLSAGTIPGALEYATSESRRTLARQFERIGSDEKIVDSKVLDVEFTNDSYNASARVAVRYFEVPYYVVKTRKEQQEWVFSISSGWKIEALTVDTGS